MTIKEVFQNPTVESVIFQILYSNLFYIENKIGDLQVQLMKEFPDSDLIFRRKMVLVDQGDKAKIETDFKESEEGAVQKIWQFRSPKGYRLNILNNSLDITSEYHKTYNNPDGEHKFRDIIELVVSNFLKLTNLPIIKRIGLRYIDKCPILSKDNVTFKQWYNSAFPLDRFSLVDVEEMQFQALIKRDNYNLRYAEALQISKDEHYLILDFDGFANDIPSGNYLSILDDLHDLIVDEYQKSIKNPVYEYMRSPAKEEK
jgi:uncharacterized protein (TIGR04255 family)